MAVDLYVTADEFRGAYLDMAATTDSQLLSMVLRASSRAVDKYVNRPHGFWADSVVQTRLYRCDLDDMAWVDDIATTDGLIIRTDSNLDGTWATTWADTDYQLEPLNADAYADDDRTIEAHAWWRIAAIDRYLFPVHPGRATLQVTARFGWSAIPADVKLATLMKAAKQFKRKDSVLGIFGLDGEGGIRISRFEDPEIVMMLDPFQRVEAKAI